MADFSSNKKDATWDEWKEQLTSMLEINGYNPSFCYLLPVAVSAQVAYHDGIAADDYFYENYKVDK